MSTSETILQIFLSTSIGLLKKLLPERSPILQYLSLVFFYTIMSVFGGGLASITQNAIAR
ncbi:hypothetical protein [Calothrix sp. 336/3]|uniref:hypothetical protein n=1 Tax=Calothrix sp. 336/3 TaxID=1337936 RepID=UPI000AAA28E8|nr:hypothetical protein [Calothrix sp. 336/3]